MNKWAQKNIQLNLRKQNNIYRAWAGHTRCIPQAKDIATNYQTYERKKKKKFIKTNGIQLLHTQHTLCLHICLRAKNFLQPIEQISIYLNVVSYYFIPFLFIFCGQSILGLGFFLQHLKIYLSQFIPYIYFAQAAAVELVNIFFSGWEKIM